MAPRSWTRSSGSRTTPRLLPGAVTPAMCFPPWPRKTKRHILAVIGAFFTLGWLSLAQAAEPPPQPPGYDCQLMLELSHKGHSSIEELDQEKVKEIPFFGEKLDFYYGVKRDQRQERLPGAIIVKVIYLYDSGTEDIEEWARKTELFRNPFPNRKDILDSTIRRTYYLNYHKDDKDNLFLIHNFHATYRDREKTDGTYQRKRQFLFTSEPQWNPEVRRQRTYLIHYEVNDQGSWIPFDVGITSQMCDLLISVIDLGQPGADLVERRWRISKIKTKE